MDEHSEHAHHQLVENPRREYLKLAGVLVFITLAAIPLTLHDWNWPHYIDHFMAVFFLVFGFFKLLSYRNFVEGFSSYDIISQRFRLYGYVYPFIQLFLGLVYLTSYRGAWSDIVVIAVSLVSSVGVLREMGSKIKCACLGNFIQLPLTKVSFIEDFGMALMATVMLILR